ncbi:MAG: hypothetical protein ACXABY_36765, partial [Candidatus Thorarchaeota archaeon]
RRAQTGEAREAAKAQAALAGIAEVGSERRERVRPPLPGTEDVSKGFLGATGLGEGTLLRDFLSREYIPETIRDTAEARQAWWSRMQPGPKDDLSASIRRGQEKARRWARLAWGPEAASEEEMSGGTFYGPGGLRGIAESSYRNMLDVLGRKQAELSEQRGRRASRSDVTRPSPAPRPDPLSEALKGGDFLAKYYRRPGTGLRRSLTPAIRY